ncbi:IS1294, transposase, truncation [Escherichia coli]|nr:IS1294, transposase, truncation [Escherichia coli]
MSHNLEHQKVHTRMVKEVLKAVARANNHPYQSVFPEKFFKMVRYFGFLANSVCGEKLPQVYKALGMDKPAPVAKVYYAQMVKQFLSRDPFECVLCGGRLVYRRSIGAECGRTEEKRTGYQSAEVYPGVMQARCACNPVKV